jgi:TolA-binding protein
MSTPSDTPTPAIGEHISESLLPEMGMETFLEKHFKKIAILGLGTLLVATAIGFYQKAQHEAAVAAAEAATQVKTPEDCDLVIQKHPGTVAAGNALLTKAALLWKANQKDTSVAALQKFVSENKDHPFIQQAQVSLASRLESLGKGPDAEKIFSDIKATHPSSTAGALSQLRLVDNLMGTGKADEAKKILETFARDFQGNTEVIEASVKRLEWISAGLPTKEVDAPPAPKVETPTTAPAAVEAPPIMIKPGQTGAMTAPITIKPSTPPAPAALITPPAPAAAPATITPAQPAAPASPAPSTPAPKPSAPAKAK